MNTFYDRTADAVEAARPLTERLIEAGFNDGYSQQEIDRALQWTAIQLDPEADDYEVWETTLLARLADADQTGER